MTFFLKRCSFWWKNNPAKAFFCFTIITLHLLALQMITTTAPTPKIKQKLVVKTFTLPAQNSVKTLTEHRPKKNTPQIQQPNPIKNKPETKKASTPTPIQPAKKNKPEIKKPLPQKIPVAQSPAKELKKPPAKIETEQNTSPSISPLRVPQKIDLNPKNTSSPVLLTPESDSDEDFTLYLIDYLQTQIQLPNIGEVKIQLTLRPDGTVEKMQVLSAESDKNRKRLEEQLPNLQFPSFPSKKGNLSNRIFILTFCNDS